MSKRQREKEEKEYCKIFNTRRKVLRSPEQNRREETEKKQINREKVEEESIHTQSMEELKSMMQSMMDKIDKNMNDIKQELREVKEEMRKKEEEWKCEKDILIDRIDRLERRAEVDEKRKKKNNIVIKGLKYNQKPAEEIKKLFEETLEVKVETKEVITLNRGKSNEVIIAEIPNWNQKQEIMAAKHKLRNTRIYIDNDLTWEERKIQREIRNIAREEKAKGKTVKIGYQKLVINNAVYSWDKQENGVTLRCEEDEQKGSKNY